MIRRLLSCALVIASTAAIAPKAFAQSVDINFSGTVQGKCNFGTPTGGVLAADGGFGNGQGASKISSLVPGGSPGQVIVSCNEPANLMISAPIQTGGPSGGLSGAIVESPFGSTGTGFGSFSGPTGPLFLPSGATPLTVHMGVESASNSYLPPGNYAYKVTLTITP
ncbi:hypothetical protein [Iningainema tapete]|uniref:Spore coat protein U domain-containing protein n=1 Tax=Iningainema tapete BLCC-T55 TaxID=2748662 RepID=A0A8J7CGZ7_9CYAN|nr:hypothetical protein [Iningainema tapete]MBD2777030.1 hypothetical protein [Iningainema tapete BLCC-T55]